MADYSPLIGAASWALSEVVRDNLWYLEGKTRNIYEPIGLGYIVKFNWKVAILGYGAVSSLEGLDGGGITFENKTLENAYNNRLTIKSMMWGGKSVNNDIDENCRLNPLKDRIKNVLNQGYNIHITTSSFSDKQSRGQTGFDKETSTYYIVVSSSEEGDGNIADVIFHEFRHVEQHIKGKLKLGININVKNKGKDKSIPGLSHDKDEFEIEMEAIFFELLSRGSISTNLSTYQKTIRPDDSNEEAWKSKLQMYRDRLKTYHLTPTDKDIKDFIIKMYELYAPKVK